MQLCPISTQFVKQEIYLRQQLLQILAATPKLSKLEYLPNTLPPSIALPITKDSAKSVFRFV